MDPLATIDPATGCPLPADAIVRVLHITPKVHVYSIPRDAVATSAGYAAASWTADPRNHIFTARLRVLETSFSQDDQEDEQQQAAPLLKVDILLEDPSSGTLFAAAPYTSAAAVEPARDSSRFFAVRVQDPSGRQKATLGVGFEERSEAFDFGVALQEAGRALNWAASSSSSLSASTTTAAAAAAAPSLSSSSSSSSSSSPPPPPSPSPAAHGQSMGGGGEEDDSKDDLRTRDLSLKEGETITVNLRGTRFGRRAGAGAGTATSASASIMMMPASTALGHAGPARQGEGEELKSLASFALPPPPPGPSSFSSSPSATARAQKRLSAQRLGFDDGQFGEFA